MRTHRPVERCEEWIALDLQRRVRRALLQEDGFSLLEVVAALSIMAIGILALAGAAGTASRMLVQGRQRQAASQVVTRDLEHIRNIPYGQVALTGNLSKSADPEHPDAAVSTAGTGFDHDGNGSFEPLVVKSDGQVFHTEVLTVGSTVLEIFRYVTWIDDPSVTGTQDYKRVVVIARPQSPAGSGRPTEVRASTFLSDGAIVVAGEEATATTGGGGVPLPSPSPTLPTASPSLPAGCTGDVSAPAGSFQILSGTGASVGFTGSTNATVSLSLADACTPITVALSSDGVNFGAAATYDPLNPTLTWNLQGGDGVKSIWARFTDGNGNARVDGPETITLDQTDPPKPGTVIRTVSCIGSNRTVTLTWGASVDANLIGYRVQRSIDGGSWTVVNTTNLLSAVDTHAKTLDSVRYRIVAYDKAGNESTPTDEISLTKNLCF